MTAPARFSRCAWIAAGVAVCAPTAYAVRYYVNAAAPPGGDGSSWSGAFNSLPMALAAVVDAGTTEIWVQSGIYRPGAAQTTGAVFTIPAGLSLHGGFAGNETELTQRDIAANPTVLSGDRLDNDIPYSVVDSAYYAAPCPPDRADNLGPVLQCDGGAGITTLTGFIFRGGYSLSVAGAGLRLVKGVYKVQDCIITDNLAKGQGSGAHIEFSSLTMSRCGLDRNRGMGSGESGGGALSVVNDIPGGNQPVYIANCELTGNVSGGGDSPSALALAAREFTVVNCQASGNFGGPVMQAARPPAPVTMQFVNCTIAFNTILAPTAAGLAIVNSGTTPVVVYNSIVRFNTLPGQPPTSGGGAVIRDISGPASSATIAFCDIASTNAGTPTSGINLDPLFENPAGPDGVIGTLDDDLRLLPISPCIDRADITKLPFDTADLNANGNTSEPVPFDLAGASRLVDDPAVTPPAPATPLDVGAFESAGRAGMLILTNSTPYFYSATESFARLLGAAAQGFVQGGGSGAPLNLSATNQPALRVTAPAGASSYLQLDEAPVVTPGDILIGDRANSSFGFLSCTAALAGPPPLVARNIIVDLGILETDGPLTATGELLIRARGALATGIPSVTGILANEGSWGIRVQYPVSINGQFIQRRSPVPGDAAPQLHFGTMSDHQGSWTLSPLTVSGSLTLTGSVEVVADSASPELPPIGTSLTLLTGSSRAGLFDTAFLPGDTRRRMRLVYSSTSRSASVSAVVESADAALNIQPPIGFPVPGSPAAAAAGKLHAANNLQPDLAVVVPDTANPTTAPGALHVLVNLGVTANAWNGWAAVTISKPTDNNPSGVCIAELSGDGLNDIAVCNRSSNSVQVFLNTGADDFGAPLTFPCGAAPSAIAAGDIDSDGDQDLAVACSAVNQVWLLFNNGSGSFTHDGGSDEITVGTDPEALFVSDLDHTGGPDIGVANKGSDSVSVIFNKGVALTRDGSQRAWGGLQLPHFFATGAEPSSIEPGQIDNGKDPDVVVGNHGSGSVTVLVPTGAGGSGSYVGFTGTIGNAPTSVAQVDLDHDGRLDIAATAQSPVMPGVNVVRVLRTDVDNQGTLTLTQSPDVIPQAPPTLVLAADLDGNGTDDLLTINPDTVASRPAVAGANPDRTALPPQTISVSLSFLPCPTDLNHDRTTNTGDLTLLLLRFGQAAPVGSPAAAADLNFDGVVNTTDLTQLLLKFGQACPA